MIHNGIRSTLVICLLLNCAVAVPAFAADPQDGVKETVVPGPHEVQLKIRMEGPYTAEVPLQVVCYFKYTVAGVQKMSGAPVELDKHLDGVIAALRERGDFNGDALETILIQAPAGSIKAKSLLLVGLGDEENLSLELMQQIGKISLREASRIGAKKVAFAPLIRDQGNSKFAAGDIASAVVRGVLQANATERQLQADGFATSFILQEWWNEAGPTYFDETVAGVKAAVSSVNDQARSKPSQPYRSTKK